MVAKSLTNRRYHPAVPRKLRNSFTDFGSGIFWIAAILSPSIRSVPPPIMNPRHSATNRRYFRWVSKSGAMISRSSRFHSSITDSLPALPSSHGFVASHNSSTFAFGFVAGISPRIAGANANFLQKSIPRYNSCSRYGHT
ncbi:uncharacterized protein LOC120322171 isoform X2 [Drosophila yakuba]|uniref:uncharacterized protein LOC120322171 isoform X2 n=1 Tax=Drosophila yakuba TaxID=7245 RepID=UPI001930877B|nr:uncharacterized protein LOC120322171 isoform X2 [Drosophila yakuba]